MNIIVAVENSSKQPEENTQALLDHLSIVYVATDESDTSGEVGLYSFCCGTRSVECALGPASSIKLKLQTFLQHGQVSLSHYLVLSETQGSLCLGSIAAGTASQSAAALPAPLQGG